MSTASLCGRHDGGQPIPRTQDGVPAALPPAQRMEFHQEMGAATDTEIGGVLRRWWLRAELDRDPEGDRIYTLLQTGTAPGTPACEIVLQLRDR